MPFPPTEERVFKDAARQRSATAATSIPPLPRMVGRAQELAQLEARWQDVQQGEGGVMLVRGEGGVGKTRLLRALREQAAADNATVVSCSCAAVHQNSALHPLIDFLLQPGDLRQGVAGQVEQLASSLRRRGLPADRAPAIMALLAPPSGPRFRPFDLSPEAHKKHAFEVMLGLLFELAAARPLLLVVEDLHWMDPSTRELLTLLIEQEPSAPIFTVLTFERTFEPPWRRHPHVEEIRLHRLPPVEADNLIDGLLDGRSIHGDLRREIVQRADGLPLFIEELTRQACEGCLVAVPSGERTAASRWGAPPIPAWFESGLMARLAPLGAAREVAALAAVLGSTFSLPLLRGCAGLREAELEAALTALMTAGLLAPQLRDEGTDEAGRFAFQHLRYRDAIYGSLPTARKRQLHLRVAQHIERERPHLTLLAYHYTEADEGARASALWHRAAEQAIRASANHEAVALARRGLAILAMQPEDEERVERESGLQLTLGTALAATGSTVAPEVRAAYDRARTLSEQAGDMTRYFEVLHGLFGFYLARGEADAAGEIATEMLRWALRKGDGDHRMTAHQAFGVARLMGGDLDSAQTHLEVVSLGAEPLFLASGKEMAGIGHPAASALSHLAWNLWLLGRPDEALNRSRAALELSRHIPFPYTRSLTVFCAAMLHVLRREPKAAKRLAEELVALANDQGSLALVAAGMVVLGWAHAQGGDAEQGVELMSQGLDGLWATGAECYRPMTSALLAEVCVRAGLVEQGLSLLREARGAVEAKGERYFVAELYRLEGELLRLQSPGEVEDRFLRALDLARAEGSMSLELRAAISLGRLWQGQGKRIAARTLLEKVYRGFREGFSTADLCDAKALLDTLD